MEPNEIIRTKRKTIALTINSKAELIVRAPLYVDNQTIKKFIDQKEKWIITKQYEIRTFNEKYPKKTYTYGDPVMFLGNEYIINSYIMDKIKIEDAKLLIPQNSEKPREAIILWYKEQALEVFLERLKFYAELMGVEYSAFKISNAQTRWGSCSSKNSINLSWRLIMCPLSVIDYVVVHELSHIQFKNHGKYFWAKVCDTLPDYQDQENWLKHNNGLMKI